MVSNQNYAGSGHIAYYWSPDWGDTWIGHPHNPIIAPGQFPDGVPSDGFQRTPTLVIDETDGRYIIAYNAGHDVTQKWKKRTYLAIASRPTSCCLMRGDINHDSIGPDISDLVFLVDYMFTGGPAPECMDAADVDAGGGLDIADLVCLVDYMFTGGPAPVECR